MAFFPEDFPFPRPDMMAITLAEAVFGCCEFSTANRFLELFWNGGTGGVATAL
jgi:hypothetical protein